MANGVDFGRILVTRFEGGELYWRKGRVDFIVALGLL